MKGGGWEGWIEIAEGVGYRVSSSKYGQRPPVLPYWIPFVGSVYPFMFNGVALMKTIL